MLNTSSGGNLVSAFLIFVSYLYMKYIFVTFQVCRVNFDNTVFSFFKYSILSIFLKVSVFNVSTQQRYLFWKKHICTKTVITLMSLCIPNCDTAEFHTRNRILPRLINNLTSRFHFQCFHVSSLAQQDVNTFSNGKAVVLTLY